MNFPILTNNGLNALLKNIPIRDNGLSFGNIVFPLITRVFGRLLANDIVTVQPMAPPTGRIFFTLDPFEGYKVKWGIRIIKSTILDY